MAEDLLERLNAVRRAQTHPNVRPKDAATLMILDRAVGGPVRVLMGRRHRDLKFYPGTYVFPGGRVDAADSRVQLAADYHPAILEKLMRDMKGPRSVARARAIGLAAIRETYEEVGLFIGRQVPEGSDPVAIAPRRTLPDFTAAGVMPSLAPLRLVARAITPPRFPRRFDTRFFAARADDIAARTADGFGPAGELEDVLWLTFEEAARLALPPITLAIIGELATRLDADPDLAPAAAVPYYRWRGRAFVRDVL